jgi:hypothetical protein
MKLKGSAIILYIDPYDNKIRDKARSIVQSIHHLEQSLPYLTDDLFFPDVGVGIESVDHLRLESARHGSF